MGLREGSMCESTCEVHLPGKQEGKNREFPALSTDFKSFYCVQGFLCTFVYFISLVFTFRNPHEVALSKIRRATSCNINGISDLFVRKLSSC